MTYEEVKELLKSVRSKKRRLLQLKEYISSERALLTTPGSQKLSEPTVMGSQDNGIEKLYAAHMDTIRKWEDVYNDLFSEMCIEEDKLSVAMQTLSPVEFEVILNRYMLGFSRRKTADTMGYSEDGIKTVIRRAMKKMTKK